MVATGRRLPTRIQLSRQAGPRRRLPTPAKTGARRFGSPEQGFSWRDFERSQDPLPKPPSGLLTVRESLLGVAGPVHCCPLLGCINRMRTTFSALSSLDGMIPYQLTLPQVSSAPDGPTSIQIPLAESVCLPAILTLLSVNGYDSPTTTGAESRCPGVLILASKLLIFSLS